MHKPLALGGALSALGLLLVAVPAAALSASVAQERAQVAIASVESDIGKPPADSKLITRPATPSERIAAGDMLVRTKDYDRAVEVLCKVLELTRQGKASENEYADASFLLAEAYFRSRQYLSGRRHYREILDRGARPPYDRFVGQALSRLVDIALRTDDLPSLDYVFARLSSLPSSDASGSLTYARAKALYARKDYASSKSAINAVPPGSEYTRQAQYLLGVILTKEAIATGPAPALATPTTPTPAGVAPVPKLPDSRFTQAIEQFRKVTRMPADSDAAKHVVDLAWMAVGRLFYETDNYIEAAEAYSHVDRGSPEFSAMLFELAWVYVRLGDFERAQRALEVLAISDPNNLQLADGSLLRADLMLRAGKFDSALALYKEVVGHFEPIRQQLDEFLQSTNDPAVYYDKLTADDLGASVDEKLPKVVFDWARDQAEDQHVFAMIDDVSRSRELIRTSRKLATKLDAVMSVPTRVKAFPEIHLALEQTLGLINRLARARGTLAEGMDDVTANGGGEIASVRNERRALMSRLGWLPTSEADFNRRDESGASQWNGVAQSLQDLNVEADKLGAIVNGLRRVLKEAEKHGVTSDVASRERFRLELDANERDLATYRRKIEEFHDAIDIGRAQIGFADQRYADDDEARQRFRELFAREVALAAAGQDSSNAAEYARAIAPALAHADNAEARLSATRASYEQRGLEQAATIRLQISQEVGNLETYAHNLDALDQSARLLVGELAMKNFGLVRDRLKSIVLRGDVGIVQEAWEVREEERVRVRNLQRERAREEQTLNDELREVLDDTEEEQ